ncbi:topoisomerase [Aestuariicella hydrocarbonica]|uniref:Topoisomerase n=1 Tax=Pseudomaricurvus hydrocarbonicus TaxID=1470433 RepID=A0A9E5MQF7_9GAMM|nr:toprim domain-containing protein [Aestuariicella hydrocarbonica]NHO68412.1 topoisomerase [Aestuariicella hydrocarbonica]
MNYLDFQNPIISFQNAMAEVGLLPQFPIVSDGEIHRFKVEGDKIGSKNGWYVFHLGENPYGAYGSWKYGSAYKWFHKKNRYRDIEPLKLIELENDLRKKLNDREKSQITAAKKARYIWSKSNEADLSHPYLIKKKVPATGIRQYYDNILVPIYVNQELVNLQMIDLYSNKKFLKNGVVKGGFTPLGELKNCQKIYVCEGWATGATLFQYLGCPVACALNAYNLIEVAKQILYSYPDSNIIIAADDDRKTELNPGKTYAEKAARAIGSSYIIPQWPIGAPENLTDFNDLVLYLEVMS